MTAYPKPIPGESLFVRHVLRPILWVAFQFTSEARFIRKHRGKYSR